MNTSAGRFVFKCITLIGVLLIPFHGISFTAPRLTKSAARVDYLQTAKVVPPPNRLADEYFGSSVALSEDGLTLVVGAPSDGYDASNSNYFLKAGSVSVYINSGGVWTFQQKIVPTTRTADSYFGTSVGISGDTIVVGSPKQKFDEAEANELSSAGAAYVFTRSAGVWTQRKKIVATGTNARVAGDEFATAVSISGSTIAVGAPFHDFDTAGANYVNAAGAVYVFTGSGATWTQQQKVIANAGSGGRVSESRFGITIGLDGDYIITGSIEQPLDASGANSVSRSGAAYVLFRTAGVWAVQAKLIAGGLGGRNADDLFGDCVSINGSTVIVGSRYNKFDTQGLNSVSNAGAVFVYTRSGTTWSFQQKLTGVGTNSRTSNGQFGVSCSVSGDMLAVGANLNSFDEQGANSVSSAGATFVFKRTRGVWRYQKKIVATGTNARIASDGFGISVSMVNQTIAIGANRQDYDAAGANFLNDVGAVYIFDKK